MIPPGPPPPGDGEGSATRILRSFKAGDPRAVDELWHRYFSKLVGLARKRLATTPQLDGYEEDAALSAFQCFYRRTREGEFADLANREDLWMRLATLTHQKVVELKRRELAQKRGGGGTLRESEWSAATGDVAGLAGIADDEPAPELVAAMSEECRRLLDLLEDPTLVDVALLRMSLYTNEEIAARYDRSLSWVSRHVKLIRAIWERAGAGGTIGPK